MRSRGSRWVLASTNPGKLAEFEALLADTAIELRALDAGSGQAPDETGSSFVENALIKARHASGMAAAAAIADDSGLCVDALAGHPGVHSARYAGAHASDAENIARLLRSLKSVPDSERQATFHCVIVALRAPDDPAPLIALGRWPGFIARAASGSHGFGYDPVFYDPELGCTAAELEPQDKNRVSHRARACAELKRLLGIGNPAAPRDAALCTS
jgi:XTP/dITP diphosphohydrolase